jgi:hypothetical protein
VTAQTVSPLLIKRKRCRGREKDVCCVSTTTQHSTTQKQARYFHVPRVSYLHCQVNCCFGCCALNTISRAPIHPWICARWDERALSHLHRHHRRRQQQQHPPTRHMMQRCLRTRGQPRGQQASPVARISSLATRSRRHGDLCSRVTSMASCGRTQSARRLRTLTRAHTRARTHTHTHTQSARRSRTPPCKHAQRPRMTSKTQTRLTHTRTCTHVYVHARRYEHADTHSEGH